MDGLGLRIGGEWVQTLGYGDIGDLSATWVWSSTGSGLSDLTFQLALPEGYTHPVLRQKQLAQLLDPAGESLGWAELDDINPRTWDFQAKGLFRRAEHFLAEGLDLQPTTNPRLAVERANLRGLGWNGVGNLPDEALSTSSEDRNQLNYIHQVLNRWCELNGMRWGLDANRVPFVSADPVAPSLALAPGIPGPATADDDYKSRYVLRFVTAEAGDPPEPAQWGLVDAEVAPDQPGDLGEGTTPHGVREEYVDISDVGVQEPAAVAGYAQNLLASNSARPAFTEAVELAPGELTNLGGVPEAPWLPVHGQRVQHFGVLDSPAGQPGRTLPWVIGSFIYRTGQRPVIAAVGLLPRTQPQMLAKQVRADDDGFA